MKKQLFFLILTPAYLLIFTLFSCSTDPNNNHSGSNPDSTEVIVPEVKKMKEYKGVYHPGQFKNAENSELFTFNDSTQKKLDSWYNKLLPNPYPNQTVSLNFKGFSDSSPTNTGFHVSTFELVSMELKNADNSPIPYDYWCMGNEPFWQVQISEKENLIDFYDPMIPKFYHFIFSKGKSDGGKTIYTSEDKGNGNSIKISIRDENCSDGMSERNYNYSSEVILNGNKYKGCAVAFGK